MDEIIHELKEILIKKEIDFTDEFYFSKDKKTILGEIPFKQILFFDYRDTDAGSNPREYTGLKKTNLSIIKSLLKDYKNMFRFFAFRYYYNYNQF